MQQQTKRPPVAQLCPPDIRDALVSAGQRRDLDLIDMLTDELVRRGLCRPRSEYTVVSVGRWAAR